MSSISNIDIKSLEINIIELWNELKEIDNILNIEYIEKFQILYDLLASYEQIQKDINNLDFNEKSTATH